MPHLSANEIEKVLDDIFDYMEKQGINLPSDKREEFKKEIAPELHHQLSAEDIKDVNVQKKLMSCITSLVMGKREEFDDMIKTLKSDEKKEPDEKLDKKLTAQFMMLSMLTNVLKEKQDNQKTMTLKPDEFKQKILQDQKDKANTPEDKEKLAVMDKQLDECLRNLYGGDNPTITGEIHFPILGPVFGNLLAYTNQSTPDPNAFSLMVESITNNAGKVDYLGLENSAAIKDLAEGTIDVANALTPQLKV